MAAASGVFALALAGISSELSGERTGAFGTVDPNSGRATPGGEAGDPVGQQYDLGSVEEEYIRQRADIQFDMIGISDRQAQLYNFCLEVCSADSQVELYQNWQDSAALLEAAEDLDAPPGYEQSHEAYMEGLSAFHDLVLKVGMQQIGGSEHDHLLGLALDHIMRSLDLMPPEGQSFHSEYAQERSDEQYDE